MFHAPLGLISGALISVARLNLNEFQCCEHQLLTSGGLRDVRETGAVHDINNLSFGMQFYYCSLLHPAAPIALCINRQLNAYSLTPSLSFFLSVPLSFSLCLVCSLPVLILTILRG